MSWSEHRVSHDPFVVVLLLQQQGEPLQQHGQTRGPVETQDVLASEDHAAGREHMILTDPVGGEADQQNILRRNRYMKTGINSLREKEVKKKTIPLTFDLPKQAAMPRLGIQVVLTTEPKPATVCRTEPSCRERTDIFTPRYHHRHTHAHSHLQ